MGEGQAEYPREAVLKEEAGTWPGERALESTSRARGLGCPYTLGFGREGTREPNIGGRHLWTCSRSGCVCQHRGHRGQVSNVEWEVRVKVQTAK